MFGPNLAKLPQDGKHGIVIACWVSSISPSPAL